ncbi:MAG: peptidylprolyl isomerase [Bacteroidales bacterium]
MRIKQIIFSLFFLGSVLSVSAQSTDDPVLMNIAGTNVTKSEFLNIYQKNNVKGEVIDKKSLDEYVELFINFKLKVKEAEELGMDTIGSFVTELSGYRKQLAQKYLVDEEVDEKLINEAYNRMQSDIRASHILLKCDPGAAPADTLKIFNKINELRDKIIKGESFENIAREFSDDLSARDREAGQGRPPIKGNGGDLGYFTVFDMVYPFENAAFNTPLGQISKPIRTEYGYHIIKVTDQKKAMGRVRVAHIFLSLQQKTTHEDSVNAKQQIFDIYSKLKSGADWDTLARQYSDDKGTGPKGGVLPWFGVNRMVPEFIQAVSKMQTIGEITEPITTPFGWHIIKFLDKKDIGSFDDVKADIKQKVTRDSRSQVSKEAVVGKIKKQYGFKEFPAAVNELLPVLDSTIFLGSWKADKAEKMTGILFILGDKNYTQKDFALAMEKDQKNKTPEDFSVLLNHQYKKYVEESCMAYKDNHLESEFPDFKNLMKEYRDGILLFDLTDKKVWTKAVKDSTGLEEFYSKNKASYLWGDRLGVTIFKGKDKEVVDKAFLLAQKQWKKGSIDTAAIFKKVNKDPNKKVTAETGKFSKGDNKWVDTVPWEQGINSVTNAEGSYFFIIVNQKFAPEPKSLNEARGMVTADYQNYLEKLWIKQLREKYSVQVFKDVLSNIK